MPRVRRRKLRDMPRDGPPLMARPRGAKPELRGGQYWVRPTITVDGVNVRRWFPLGTDSLSVANAKNRDLMARIARGEVPLLTETRAPETFEQAARRILDQQEADGMKSIADRRQRVRDYATPTLGKLAIDKVRAGHVREALEACRDAGRAKQTITHLRNDLSSIFDQLWRDELIEENPVDKVRVPKGGVEDQRPRQLLTDEEFAAFMACTEVPALLRVMALSSRAFGGMRTSDLHAWRWEHIDTREWRTAQVRRPKTKGLALMLLPAVLTPWLREWWASLGRPSSGPVFPVGRGDNATEHRGHTGYARQLRKWLRRAFGIDAVTGQSGGRDVWSQVRELTPREHELLNDVEFTKRLDFHSFRRAYSTALADANVNLQTAMALTGHRKAETHMRYVDKLKRQKPLATPAEVLPKLEGNWLEHISRIVNDIGGADGTRTRGLRRDRRASPSFQRAFASWARWVRHQETGRITLVRQNVGAKPDVTFRGSL